MKILTTLVAALASISATQALLIPSESTSLARRDAEAPAKREISAWNNLWKRKGGGGGKGGGSSSGMHFHI